MVFRETKIKFKFQFWGDTTINKQLSELSSEETINNAAG